ncbi:hypothetical protein SBRY_70323 [Actinacidiphila bryophytorum]|uniref:Uncharacterized protein n=1 Tax=Actinacidiphila bryophytorum TaxID=1436133 RepID=A0A9W4MKS0_9ACTN|nr:hypothetical protein SBRY_70323 [Actinacidiphila bryophytorum]
MTVLPATEPVLFEPLDFLSSESELLHAVSRPPETAASPAAPAAPLSRFLRDGDGLLPVPVPDVSTSDMVPPCVCGRL